jgi:hypothetical protein
MHITVCKENSSVLHNIDESFGNVLLVLVLVHPKAFLHYFALKAADVNELGKILMLDLAAHGPKLWP